MIDTNLSCRPALISIASTEVSIYAAASPNWLCSTLT